MVVTKEKLEFGPSDRIFYSEFDGQRRKRVPGVNPPKREYTDIFLEVHNYKW